MNEEEFDYDFYDAVFNDVLEELEEVKETPEDTPEEIEELTPEETPEETEEVTLEELPEETAESTQETIQDVWIDNFDLLDTPLNSCSSVTISLLFILFFLALATIGGVIRD